MLDDPVGLGLRLARVRALLHIDKEKEAAEAADAAVAMVERTPALASFRPLTLDRAALANLAAGRFARARALYDAVLPVVDAAGGAEARRNRVVLRLPRAAAHLGDRDPGRALADLDVVDRAIADPDVASSLAWPNATLEQALRTYRTIAAGLRANADTAVGRLPDAAAALERRRVAVVEQIAKSDRDEDRRVLVTTELHLADNAADRGDYGGAARWLGRALADADQVLDRTHATVSKQELDVLWFAAELGAFQHTPMPFDLPKRLTSAHDELGKRDDATFRSYQRWLEIYLPLVRGR